MDFSRVEAWSEMVTIPTYRIGEPDKNPMFLEKRVYQGSSGVVYPHPVIDRVFDEKVEQEYTAVFLENRYLKLMILPEIGGRLQMALDKTNNYHFVYYNQVIKPALVGLTGPGFQAASSLTGRSIIALPPSSRLIGISKATPTAARPCGVLRLSACSAPRECTALPCIQIAPIWK